MVAGRRHRVHPTDRDGMMSTLFAVDDGISSGNLNLADVCFLIAVVLAVISALAHYRPASAGHAGWLLSAAVAAVALGFLLI
jgi:hypothetical protein